MTGEIVPSREQGRLVYWSGDDSLHGSVLRQLNRSLYGQSAQPPGRCRRGVNRPIANRFIDVEATSFSAHQYQIRTPADPVISERFPDYLGPDAARITGSYSEPNGQRSKAELLRTCAFGDRPAAGEWHALL